MRVCTVCRNARRGEIETASVRGDSLRDISGRFGVSKSTVERHQKHCIADLLAKRRSTADQVRAVNVDYELRRSIERILKLFDACHDCLTDPDNPGEYSLACRAADLPVVWEELERNPASGEEAKWIKRTGSLQEALDLAFSQRRLVKAAIPTRISDPSKLILKTADQLCRQLEIMAKLEGRFRPVEKPTGDGNTIQLAVVQQILVQAGLLKG